jgi:hypothetical protein
VLITARRELLCIFVILALLPSFLLLLISQKRGATYALGLTARGFEAFRRSFVMINSPFGIVPLEAIPELLKLMLCYIFHSSMYIARDKPSNR